MPLPRGIRRVCQLRATGRTITLKNSFSFIHNKNLRWKHGKKCLQSNRVPKEGKVPYGTLQYGCSCLKTNIRVLKKNLKKGLAQAILTAISLPRARATSARCCRYLNEQSIVLGPPGCAQASPYLSPGLLDFLVV